MLQLNDHKIVFDFSKCQQCGACVSVCPTKALSSSTLDNGLLNIAVDHDKCIRCQKCITVCPPANTCEINPQDYTKALPEKDFFLAFNSSREIRSEASSGGVCRTLIIESLRNGIVDGVYALGKQTEFPYASGHFFTADNIPDYTDLPNSVYHSVPAARNIQKVKRCERLMLVGTACQLKAMTAAVKGKYKHLIRVCIFCKQQKTLDSTRFIAKMAGSSLNGHQFQARYRGNGWPGTIEINGRTIAWRRAASLPFGRRLWSVPGCNVCGDPFGIYSEADLSLMDPWSIRKDNELGETLVIAHTPAGRKLLHDIQTLECDKISYEEARPALDLKDIERKQRLIPFFRGEKKQCTDIIRKAGKAEQRQRRALQKLLTFLPTMPIIIYRIIARLPDMRNSILK